MRWDLLVVGAGPAGSAAAIAALRTRPDARVLLVDRAEPGRDKVCGDGIAPHAAAELAALGVDVLRKEEKVATVRLVGPGGGNAAAATTVPGHVVPRRDFDRRLLEAAIEAGARFEQRKVTAASAGSVDGYDAAVVIGADGAHSVVRRGLGLPGNRGRALAVGVRGYAPTPADSAPQLVLRWDRRRSGGLGYAWAFPTVSGVTNVGYALASAAHHSRRHLEERAAALLPELDVPGTRLTGHTLPLSVSRPPAASGRVLLAGDAASLINPFTGEGIYAAIASGTMAGRAAFASDPAANYIAALSARFGRQHRQTTALNRITDLPVVLDTVIRAARRDRRLFDRLLDVGLGDAAFSLADLARFGRHLL